MVVSWLGQRSGGRDGNERQAEVGDLAQDAVQRGLVDDEAGEHGGAVAGRVSVKPSNQAAQRGPGVP